MRDAAGQAADRGEPLGLLTLLGELPAVGDIGERRKGRHDPASAVPYRRGVHLKRQTNAVAAQALDLFIVDQFATKRPRQRILLGIVGPAVGVNASDVAVVRSGQDLARGLPQDANRGVVD